MITIDWNLTATLILSILACDIIKVIFIKYIIKE